MMHNGIVLDSRMTLAEALAGTAAPQAVIRALRLLEVSYFSLFNYRLVAGTERLSHHASGRAVDINPLQNPAVYKDGRIEPPGAVYNPGEAGAVSEASPVVQAFLKRGWQWGAEFETVKDYHHFQKP
jgi:hypothetical protein